MAGRRTYLMTLIASLSLLIGVLSLFGSAVVVSDGLGFTRLGTVSGAPAVGTPSVPPVDPGARVVAFGLVRLVLSLLLVAGAIGTLGVAPAGRRLSLAYAVGWIVLGGLEPWVLGYRFGWEVIVSALYPFLLLALFSRPSWRRAFASAPRGEAPAPPPPL